METQCQQCQNMPFTHSFFIEKEDENQVWFFSGEHHVPHVDRTVSNVISHIRGELSYLHNRSPGKKWSWIVDGGEFEFRWDTITLILEMIYVVQDYKDTFLGMHVKKANSFMIQTIEYCKPFVSSEWLDLLFLE